LNVEESLELGGDVLEKRENAVVGVLVPEGVEDEAIFSYERVSIGGNPISRCRFNTPRKEWRLKTKKAIAFKSSVCFFAIYEAFT
jgi:hypothetical protein